MFDEKEVVNTDYEEAPVFDDDPYEAETKNIFVNKYPSLKEPSMLVEEESCPVYDTDNEEESEVIYDTYGNDVDDSPKFELLHTDQGGWIHAAVMRNVKNIHLKIFLYNQLQPIVLPPCLVHSASLEMFSLNLLFCSLSFESFTGSKTLKVL
nr:hypothetical protein [Tanacetum cinerariifolium]